MNGILIDTNVLVDYLRDLPQPIRSLENARMELRISALTVAELHAGAWNDKERMALREFTAAFDVIPADGAVCGPAGEFRDRYKASHSVDLIDGIIAATAVLHALPLATLNRKHFPMLRNTVSPYQRRYERSDPRLLFRFARAAHHSASRSISRHTGPVSGNFQRLPVGSSCSRNHFGACCLSLHYTVHRRIHQTH